MSSIPVVRSTIQRVEKAAASPKQNKEPTPSTRLNQVVADEEPIKPSVLKPESIIEENTNINNTISEAGNGKLLEQATKLKNQNIKLKAQLKELKNSLRDTLIKVKEKNKKPDPEVVENSKETELQHELDRIHKQIAQYRKETQGLRHRLEGYHNQERVVKLENILKEKDKKLEKLLEDKRNIEKVKFTQQRDLDALQKEYGFEKKLQILGEDARNLREKIRDIQLTNRRNEKTFKKQQEYVVALTNQYRIICDKLGLSHSLNFTRADDLNNILKTSQENKNKTETNLARRINTEFDQSIKKKNDRSKSVKEKERELPKIEANPANIEKLEASIEELQNQISNVEKDHQKEINSLEAKKQELSSKVAELELKFKDKEKEAKILSHRTSELKRTSRFNSVKPLTTINYKSNDKLEKLRNNSSTPSHIPKSASRTTSTKSKDRIVFPQLTPKY